MISSDNEPAVKVLVQAVALHREDETVIEEIPVESSQSIGCKRTRSLSCRRRGDDTPDRHGEALR